MKLFEVTNGFTGCSYVRVYVWASDKLKAIEMSKAKLKVGTFVARFLFSSDSASFCTEISDEGWVSLKDGT